MLGYAIAPNELGCLPVDRVSDKLIKCKERFCAVVWLQPTAPILFTVKWTQAQLFGLILYFDTAHRSDSMNSSILRPSGSFGASSVGSNV